MDELSDFNGRHILSWMPKKTRSKSRDNLRGGVTLKKPLTPWIKKMKYITRIMMQKQFRRELELKWSLHVEQME